MKGCGFNGAPPGIEARWDPRFDCTAEAVWHVLVTPNMTADTHDGGDDVFSCEDHSVDPLWIIQYHRLDEPCGRSGFVWRTDLNRCEVHEKETAA